MRLPMKRYFAFLLTTFLVTTTITACAPPKAPLDNRWLEGCLPPTIQDSKDAGNPDIPQLSITATHTDSDAGEKTLNTTSFNRTLVITVSKKGTYHPGERIVRSRIIITPKKFKFSNYTIAATEYSTVDIDNITTKQTIGYGADLSPTLPFGSTKLSATYSNSIEDMAKISQRVEQLTVSIDKGSLIVYRESERGIDLTGNTLIRISLQPEDPDSDKFVDKQVIVNYLNIKDAKGLLLSEKQASIGFITATITKPKDDFSIDASMEYIIRRITSGASTYTESDDEIQWVVSPVPPLEHEFLLIAKREMEVPRWVIVTPEEQTLMIETLSGTQQIRFTNFGTAQEFVGWLKINKASKVGSLPLLVPTESNTLNLVKLSKISKGNYPDFRIKRADN